MSGMFSDDGIARLQRVLERHVDAGEVTGLAWLAARRDDVRMGVAGALTVDGGAAVARDIIFRISSMTKPVTAVATMILVEDCVLRLDDPVDQWLPELADRHVLANPEGPMDEVVPAPRAITVRDALTFRLGWGMDFANWERQPVLDAMAALGLGVGPPNPTGPPPPDEWIRRLGTLPLASPPGDRWLYHTGAEVLGVLIARASGQPFGDFLRERIFEPLGMRDTGFSVPASSMDRFGPAYWSPPDAEARTLFDPPDGMWSAPPAFPSGGAGLVSTVDDYFAFAAMLRGGGSLRGTRMLSRAAVELMRTNHLTDEQRLDSGPDPSGAQGWGFGVGVQVKRTGLARSVGSYGWDGGLGSSWANDPAEDLIGILLTNEARTSPTPPPICDDFWTCAYSAIDD